MYYIILYILYYIYIYKRGLSIIYIYKRVGLSIISCLCKSNRLISKMYNGVNIITFIIKFISKKRILRNVKIKYKTIFRRSKLQCSKFTMI